jgi:hypothetical protein
LFHDTEIERPPSFVELAEDHQKNVFTGSLSKA